MREIALIKAIMLNPFFKNYGPFKIIEIIKFLKINLHITNDVEVNDIKDLSKSATNDLTFFHSKKYKEVCKKN